MNRIKVALVLVFLFFSKRIFGQEVSKESSASWVKNKAYVLKSLKVSGNKVFSDQSVKAYSGLLEGSMIKVPGDKIATAVRKLYETKRFDLVDVYVDKVEDDGITLLIEVKELPQLHEVIAVGIKPSKLKSLIKDAELKKGAMVTENLLVTTKNYFEKKQREKGYLNAKVNIVVKPLSDSIATNAVDLVLRVDKGSRVKISDITINGNKEVSDSRLRRTLKNTKRRNFWRFWKRSKFVAEKFEEDLKKLIEKYQSLGFRDARVLAHQVIPDKKDKDVRLNIDVQEGKRYYFGDISFLGNSVFQSDQLSKFLKIRKGDVYNNKLLDERVKGDGKPDSDDLSSLYQNSGYLFSNVDAVETNVRNDSIDIEIRIREDKPATIKNVTVTGNEVTNDRVIYRELRTRPGQLYSKQDIIRTIREISQMRFFDPQNVTPNINPNYNEKTVDISYNVAKRGTSQIELQGGYGNAFIGTIGLSFNNFSFRNMFKKEEYKPLPMGDAQSVSLRLQASQFFKTYSFSFQEPWLGGVEPRNLSFSISRSIRYNYNFRTREVDSSRRLNIVAINASLGQRLKWPDDFFVLSQGVSYQLYDIQKYPLGILNFENGTGESHNLAYTLNLSRNSSGPNPIFPKTGSNFSFSLKATVPYSLLSGKRFDNLKDKKEYQRLNKDDQPLINPDDGKPFLRQGKINQEKYRWLEYYKMSFQGRWFTALVGDLVLMTNAQVGYLGYYNSALKDIPFERYFVGGDGLQQNQFDGREVIGLRGYQNNGLSSSNGGRLYTKFTTELRYPITLKPSASIYVTSFLEGGNSYEDVSNFNPFQIKKSAGMGLRIFMPAFGMLGIDFGYGFDPHPGSATPSGWQTHFIIGQQF